MKKLLTPAAFIAVAIFLATGCKKMELPSAKKVTVSAATDTNFVCPLLQKEGVLIQSKVSTTNNLGAEKTLYLDTDGEYVFGTVWNTNGPYTFPGSGLAPDSISKLVTLVQYYLNPWNVKVTTDRAVYEAANPAERIMSILSPTSTTYFGVNWTGAAYVNSWYWVTNPATPFFVFTGNFGNMMTLSRGIIHEFGHTLGCYHQAKYDQNCNLVFEYLPMEGDGELSWCTFMANPYQGSIATFFIGTPYIPGGNTGCTQEQNDLDIFDQALGRRVDDISDQMSGACPLTFGVQKVFVTEKFTDVDWFKFTSTVSCWVNLRSFNTQYRVYLYKNGVPQGVLFPMTTRGGKLHVFTDSNPNTVYHLKVFRSGNPSNNPRIECNLGTASIEVTTNEPGY